MEQNERARKEKRMAQYTGKARSSFQTGRQGWRPRKTSQRTLVRDIVAGILRMEEAGRPWVITDFTHNPVTAEMVHAMLGRTDTEHAA
jgi:hypothetical protein